MADATPKELVHALQQYCHNNGEPGFIFGYEYAATNKAFAKLRGELARVTAQRDALRDEQITRDGVISRLIIARDAFEDDAKRLALSLAKAERTLDAKEKNVQYWKRRAFEADVIGYDGDDYDV